jgi:hypothetical protein
MTHLLLNRSLLFRDLNDLGISTKFLNTIKTIYSQVECAIKLNGKTAKIDNFLRFLVSMIDVSVLRRSIVLLLLRKPLQLN